MGQISAKEVGRRRERRRFRPGVARRISDKVAQAEAPLAGLLIAAVFSLLIANVVTRALVMPVYWIDELAIYTMIWSAFVGASLCLNRKTHIAVTLLPDMLPARYSNIFVIAVNMLLVMFFLIIAVVLWRWFDPLTMLSADNLFAFSQTTFNFIYDEPTTTIGVRKVWFWLIMPIFCVTGFLHSFANLIDAVIRLKREQD